MKPRALLSLPLAVWERDAVKAALMKTGLPIDDLGDPNTLFWRFETAADVPAGFGGLEIYAPDALLRSVITLPQVRRLGIGRAIVAALEIEARARQCLSMYVASPPPAEFFARLGYRRCAHDRVPEGIRRSSHFDALRSADATVLFKEIA